MNIPPDQAQRSRALDPHNSFIVQAPAGSGKTELLVQRFLTLLALVTQPEEIIAITFTRKAAAEMRSRILDALNNASENYNVENSPQQTTKQLAINVLQRDTQLHWNLLKNPNRLQILTIDALCLNLTRRMPMLSHFGAQPDIIENATDYYLQAARKFLATLETEQPWSESLQQLLLHLDNNHKLAEQLFVAMLAHREQWLPHILGAKNQLELRTILEQGLKNIILENLTKCYQEFPKDLQQELISLANYAAANLKNSEQNSSVINCLDIQKFPTASVENFKQWLGIANLLLTNDFTWRKQINVRLGFPPVNKAMIQRMKNLLIHLESLTELQQSLQNIIESPAATYHNDQWQIVNALVQLLPVLAAQLTIIFRAHGKVDFVEISSSAIKALGEPGAPSDLALHLDYRIQHLLVDEFQDTSLTQFRLIELLTAGWQSHDGRTLFLVGDPMQSIYRFRQAEVGLFLRAKEFGIGNLKLLPIILNVNFRSDANIVTWLNSAFTNLFPKYEDIAAGAVTFNQSTAAQAASSSQQIINVLPFINSNSQKQAKQVTEIVQSIRKNSPSDTIAILVRSRTHLQEIIPSLKAAGIKFRGVEIEKLSDHPVVQDLFALTRALLHLADKIAWLSILRAPWCGLTLSDLLILANFNKKFPLWKTLQQSLQIKELSADAQVRLQRIMPILSASLQNRQRQSLRTWIEQAWRELGGPACCHNENDLECATSYFELLEKQLANDDIEDLAWLEKQLTSIYAPADHQADNHLQIMTIHKAKGLEFDTVILPSLERKTTHDENRLLLWLERPRSTVGSDLILAPIKSSFDSQESIYQYLKLQEKIKSDYEMIRLLYVAVTRAKKNLYLLGTATYNVEKNAVVKPSAGSFLNLLWTTVENQFLEILPTQHNNKIDDVAISLPQTLTRLKSTWHAPITNQENFIGTQTVFIPSPPPTQELEFVDISTSIIGTLIHRVLQKISQGSVDSWQVNTINTQHNMWKKQLIELGMPYPKIDASIAIIDKALKQTLQDQRGRWLLTQHSESHSEWPLTMWQNNQIIHMIIDRTFIYEDTRWIVDYKTSQPSVNENMKNFLIMQKQVHWSQLQLYAQAMQSLENRPIRLGLYFPLFSGWIEEKFDPGSEN